MRLRPEFLAVEASLLVRIATAAAALPRAYRLQYGESDAPTPEFICRAAYEAARAGHTFYTDPSGYAELREAIVEKLQETQGVERRPSEVTVTVGATQAIHLALRAFLGPGDNAVVLHPAYSIFPAVVRLCGAEPRAVPLERDGPGFALDAGRVRDAIDRRTRVLVVNSPANPTGWVARREELETLWKLALAHDLVVLSDEVYDRLVYDGDVAQSMAAVATDPERLVVVNSFSKTYDMTGWRLGWALSGERTISALAKVQEFMTSSAPAPIQQAGIVALRDGEAHVAQLRKTYARRRKAVAAALSGIAGVSLPEPRGGFYAFPRVEGLHDSMEFALGLLERTGVALAPGSAFGAGGEGHLRLCFAVSDEVLAPALALLREALLRR